jgi:hypothetical protein
MGDKDHAFIFKRLKNALCEDSIGNSWVYCT